MGGVDERRKPREQPCRAVHLRVAAAPDATGDVMTQEDGEKECLAVIDNGHEVLCCVAAPRAFRLPMSIARGRNSQRWRRRRGSPAAQ